MKSPIPSQTSSEQSLLPRWVVLSCLAGLLFSPPGLLSAEKREPAENLEPQVSLVQSSAQRLIDDLDSAMSLTTIEEQKQTDTIKEFLELNLKGMAYHRLARMDFLVGEGPVRYRPAFPIANERKYWEDNLEPNDIDTLRLASGFYKTSGAFEGYMRMRHKYAIFGEQRKDLPVESPSPDEPAITDLLKLTDNAALKLTNVITPDAVAFRRKSYHDDKQGLRQELLNQIKKTKSETQNTFDLRKLAFEHQLDHLERLYVEAETSLLLGHYDPADNTMALDLDILSIENTALEKYIQSLNEVPLSFANIPQAAKSNLSLRMRMPLDEMMQRHAAETLDLLKKIAHQEAKANKEKTADQKEATREVIDLSYKLLLANIQSGLADGFIECHPDGNNTNTAIAAFKAADGNAPLAILNLLEKARGGQKVVMNLATANGVNIHSFLVSNEQHPGFRQFFGGSEMYVGTSPDAIWLGAGPQAVKELKAAIQETEKPNKGKASDPFLTLSGRIAPWMEFHTANYPDAGTKLFRKYRRLVVEAGQDGDDQFETSFNRDDDKVVGNWQGQRGWARFVGKYLADFTLNNIQAQ